jgi:hypothetical protein
MKAPAVRALKMTCLFATLFLLAQASSAQSADDKAPGDMIKAISTARPYLDVHPGGGKDLITVGHPATDNPAQLTLVDTNDKIVQQVAVNKNSRQTKLNISSLAGGAYKIVWSDGVKKVEQPLYMMQ